MRMLTLPTQCQNQGAIGVFCPPAPDPTPSRAHTASSGQVSAVRSRAQTAVTCHPRQTTRVVYLRARVSV